MTSAHPPIKAVFFDIGGVCVHSPMLAIADYEHELSLPVGYINTAISAAAPHGAWQKLERGEITLDASFYAQLSADIESPLSWRLFHTARGLAPATETPPRIDGKKLFREMMARSHVRDRIVMAAVRALRERGITVAALTNDYQYPDGHPYHPGKNDLRREFDKWIASSEVGLRKPEKAFYEEAMKAVGISDGRQVAFLDDIGINLKAAAELGWRTVRVPIGGSRDAVRVLEGIVGMRLLEKESRL